MQKKIFFLFLTFCFAELSAQETLQSPEQYLGYKLGEKYTQHYKIVNYFQSVANALPASVKLTKYGETYEGRPLMLAFISSPENIRRLEEIRLNNLRLAGLSKDKMAASEDAPAIVWLSYNVHGNETSSSEAAMKTLYTLVDPSNAKSKEWLRNTIVVIDPCINPDGRDRYVNWFNSVANRFPDADPQSREHREPWPGGRTNHYYFDLNRDWAWQTQKESQERVKAYNEWLPHVHVDYHEMGTGDTYYFAPAAEPYHEVITTWQRELQTTIGKNNAKYFDESGWLYFTKENFDLFYPSYGDTYPTYNGAIGMTYEQAGGSAGGLAVAIEAGDTLRLADRIQHHYTTGLSTIETTSLNAARIIKEFRKFFSDAITNGYGEYKTYIIKQKSTSVDQMRLLGAYLKRNGIEYGYAQSNTPGRGYNYVTGKEESFQVEQNDIVISEFQPKAVLLKVLFEPKSKLSDSATYDITAWALPYALGLETYAIKEKLNGGGYVGKSVSGKIDTSQYEKSKNAYAYVIPWKNVSSAKLLSRLLLSGVKVSYAERPFEVNGRKYESGSLIITKAANKQAGANLFDIVQNAATKKDDYHYWVEPVYSGYVEKGFDFGSGNVRSMKKPKVALLTGDGVSSNAVGEIWHFFEQQLGYPLTLINQGEITRVNWNNIDVLIMPDGNYRFLGEKSVTDELKNWVQSGGRLVAIENAVSQLSSIEWAINKKKDEEKKDDEKDKAGYEFLKKYENRKRDFLPGTIPGAVYKVEIDNSHPLAFGYPGYYFTLKLDDNIYEFFKEDGWNVGVIKKESYMSGFAGSKTKLKLKDGLLFGVQSLGRGNIVYLADNPIFRSFWENGKLMLSNAVFMVGQ